jgi:hypothetical protein
MRNTTANQTVQATPCGRFSFMILDFFMVGFQAVPVSPVLPDLFR